jgi:hypothetical protein
MPEITEITTSYQRKVQLEQYEPITHTVELRASVEEDEDVDDAYDFLADRAEDMVERALARRISQKKLSDNDG